MQKKDVFGHVHCNYEKAEHYQGHTGSGGIQNHSVGESFPYMVEGYTIDADSPTMYRVLDGTSGRRFGHDMSCHDAHELADLLKKHAPYIIMRAPLGFYFVARQDGRGEFSTAQFTYAAAERTLYAMKARDTVHG